MTYSLSTQQTSTSQGINTSYRYAIVSFDHAAFITDRYISFLDKKTSKILKRKITSIMTDETFFSQLSPSDAYRVGFMAGEAAVIRDEISKVLGCAYQT